MYDWREEPLLVLKGVGEKYNSYLKENEYLDYQDIATEDPKTLVQNTGMQ